MTISDTFFLRVWTSKGHVMVRRWCEYSFPSNLVVVLTSVRWLQTGLICQKDNHESKPRIVRSHINTYASLYQVPCRISNKSRFIKIFFGEKQPSNEPLTALWILNWILWFWSILLSTSVQCNSVDSWHLTMRCIHCWWYMQYHEYWPVSFIQFSIRLACILPFWALLRNNNKNVICLRGKKRKNGKHSCRRSKIEANDWGVYWIWW